MKQAEVFTRPRWKMPSNEGMGLVHKAVLWKRVGTDKNSRPIVSSTPEEIECRWDGRSRIVYNAQGEPIAVDATAVVDREIAEGSALVRGKIDDLPGTGQTPVRNVMEVASYDFTDDLRGMETHREIGMVRSADTLPRTGADAS